MSKPGCLTCKSGRVVRRHFLRVGSLSLLGMNLSQYLNIRSVLAAGGSDSTPTGKAQAAILLWLEGGTESN